MCTVMEENRKSCRVFKIPLKSRKSYAFPTRIPSSDINCVYSNGKDLDTIESDGLKMPESNSQVKSTTGVTDLKDPKSATYKANNKPMTGLDNLGNTCFLNSILYVLRFTPGFRQKLHFLANDIEMKQEERKGKLELIPGDHLVLEMHSVFKEMYRRETKNGTDSLSPQKFLDAVRQHCLYGNNSQEDAHELLVYLLDYFSHCNNSGSQSKLLDTNICLGDSLVKSVDECNLETFPLYRKKKREKEKTALSRLKKRQKKDLELDNLDSISICSSSSACSSVDYLDIDVNGMHINGTCGSFIQDLLEGKAVTRTRCLECECYTDTKQEFTNLQVSWTNLEKTLSYEEEGDIILLQKALCETELLQDVNKYYCNYCKHLTEACRSVHYDTLPPVVILQLKTFLAESEFLLSKGSPSIPIPFLLPCFCEMCLTNKAALLHQPYQLYGVIFHIGLSIASGHYVAYVRRKVAQVELPLGNGATGEQEPKKSKKGFAKYFSMSSKPKVLCSIQDCCNINVRLSGEAGPEAGDSDWLECDDSNVKFVSEDKVQTLLKCAVNSPTTPYLLFYSNLFS